MAATELAAQDAAILREAVRVLRQRTRKPKGFVFGVLVKMLGDVADKIEQGSI